MTTTVAGMGDDLGPLVRALRAEPTRTAILLDFDGTLAPIVDEPSAAVLLPGASDALSLLHVPYRHVAVISGRPASFLHAHLPAGLSLVGLYGLEELQGGDVVTHPEAASWRPVIDDLAAAAVAELPSGVGVEHKGLSLTLHVRTNQELAATVAAWATAAGERSGLLVRRARMSAELHPPVATDKGTVVRELLRDVDAACFFGDDVGDLPAFDALDDFASGGGTAVRFVVESPELAPEMRTRADALLAGPPAVLEVLRSLVP